MKKKLLDSLLKTYSSAEVGNIFSKINGRINNINEYSSKDFLKLNADFKKYYADAKKISDSTTSLFNSFEKSPFNQYYELFLKHHESILFDRTNYIESLDKILQQTEFYYNEFKTLKIPFSNLLQNLMTIKLLTTSLVTENLTNNRSNVSTQIQDTLLKIDEIIYIVRILDSRNNDVKSEFGILIQNLKNNLKIQIKTHLSNFTQNKTPIQSIWKKYNNWLENLPKILSKNTDISKNIEHIITNLQYQDIIRQRIDHIQQTQQDVVLRLQLVEQNKKTCNSHEKAKSFMQIRDISGLQAAQLFHVSKEYQKAINVIVEMFSQLGSNLTAISDISQSFFHTSQHIYNDNSESNLNSLIYNFSQMLNIEKQIDNFIMRSIKNVSRNLKDIQQELQIAGNIDKLFKTIISNKKSNKKEHNKLIENIQFLKTEIDKELETIIQKLASCHESIDKEITEYKNSNEKEKYSDSEFTSNIQELIKVIDSINTEFRETLNQNRDLCNQINKNINDSINNIEYYEYFEKEINLIIEDLNLINYQLKAKTDSESIDKKENLEYIKQRYTTKEEYFVHEKVSSLDKMDEIIKSFESFELQDSQQEEDADDDVEFF